MKQMKIIIAVLIVLFITTSTASAAYSYNSGNGHSYYNHRFHPGDSSRQCANCSSGNNCSPCTNGNCCPGENCNTCQGCNCSSCSGGDCNNGSGDTNTPPNNCPGGNCDNGSGDTTTPPVNPPTDATGTTTYKLCSDNVCNVGGNGKVLTLTNYNNATDPTYDQLLTFLKADKTDALPYNSQFVCSDFAQTLHNNAEAAGIRCAWIGCSFTQGIGHAFNEFKTTDKGIVYIDCTGVPGGSTDQDKILTCTVGKSLAAKYLFRSGSINNMGIVADLDVFW